MKQALMEIASAWSTAFIILFFAFAVLCTPISPTRAEIGSSGNLPIETPVPRKISLCILWASKSRLIARLSGPTSYREQHNKLFAARQALCWAINPETAASPYQAIMGTQGAPEGYLAEPHPPRS
jgi:hypothetical protein